MVPQEGFTALSREVWEEAAILEKAVASISVYNGGRIYTWLDLCVKFSGDCVDNTFLDLLNTTHGDLDDLKYPVMEDRDNHIFHPLMAHLGGVEVEEGTVSKAEALRLSFMLDDSSKTKKEASLMWTSSVRHFMLKTRLKTSDVSCFIPKDVEQELVDNIQTAFEENFPLIVVLVSIFTIHDHKLHVHGLGQVKANDGGGGTVMRHFVSNFRLWTGFVPWNSVASHQCCNNLPTNWYWHGCSILDAICLVTVGAGE